MTTPVFRKDINGLRAYAVIAVVLYHFDIGLFSGGFAGVDIFFVISGYLMTSIILSSLARNEFSIKKFYLDRTRRIFPALAFLCLAMLVFGYSWLAPTDYSMLAEHARSSVLFFSNFVYNDEAGYFDSAAKTKWLLHTWSLSVEWQFYIVYPIFLIFLYKKTFAKGAGFWGALILVSVISFLASIGGPSTGSSWSFYILPARVWEFLAGGFAFLLLSQRSIPCPKLVEAAGIFLMLGSFFVFDANTPWPGSAVLMPVAGAMLVILANRTESVWTANTAMQLLGKWSYSIYLWHWPVVVALDYWGLHSAGWQLAGIMGSLCLGVLSFRLIEEPFRKRSLPGLKNHGRYILAASLFVLIGAGSLIVVLKGLPERVPVSVLGAEAALLDKHAFAGKCGYDKKTGLIKRCWLGESAGNEVGFVLWGDSHAMAVATALRDASLKPGLRYTFLCPTIFNVRVGFKSANHPCKEFNEAVLADISSLSAGIPIFVVNRFSNYLHGQNEGVKQRFGLRYLDMTDAEQQEKESTVFKNRLTSSLCRIAEKHPVYVLQPIPEMGENAPLLTIRHLMTGRPLPDIRITKELYQERHADTLTALRAARDRCGVHLVDPLPALCERDSCAARRDGEMLYYDDDHLSETGNRRLVPLFREILAAPHAGY